MAESHEAQLINGTTRTVRELFTGRKYALDFYQREYTWTETNVSELLEDLAGAFLRDDDAGDGREKVAGYRPYFLGPVVTNHTGGVRLLVDGQQRLTTLTLLIICLDRLAEHRDGADAKFLEAEGREASTPAPPSPARSSKVQQRRRALARDLRIVCQPWDWRRRAVPMNEPYKPRGSPDSAVRSERSVSNSRRVVTVAGCSSPSKRSRAAKRERAALSASSVLPSRCSASTSVCRTARVRGCSAPRTSVLISIRILSSTSTAAGSPSPSSVIAR